MDTEENSEGGQRSPRKKSKQGQLVWSIVKSQFQALCKTLSESNVDSLILTSQGFQYCGSKKGTDFLQDRIGFKDGLNLKALEEGSKDGQDKSLLVWEIVEKQFQALVKTMSDMGVDSLILTSRMTNETGFCGSEKGLDFLKRFPETGKLFMAYCSDADLSEAKDAENSIFSKWFGSFEDKESDNSEDENEASETESPSKSPKSPRLSSRIMARKEELQKGKDTPTGTSPKSEVKAGRGRPRKLSETPAEKKQTELTETPKRGRGRPPKNVTPSAKTADEDKVREPSEKRGRGRPPKSATPVVNEEAGEEDEGNEADEGNDTDEVKSRGRGRPRKKSVQNDTVEEKDKDDESKKEEPKRGRGRPRKSIVQEEEEEGSEDHDSKKEGNKSPKGGDEDKEKGEEGSEEKEVKRGRGRPRKSDVASTPVATKKKEDVAKTPSSELRLKGEPPEGVWRSSRKKAVFECEECKETFSLEYLLSVHQKRCLKEARLKSPPAPKTPKKEKVVKTPKAEQKEQQPQKSTNEKPTPKATAKAIPVGGEKEKVKHDPAEVEKDKTDKDKTEEGSEVEKEKMETDEGETNEDVEKVKGENEDESEDEVEDGAVEYLSDHDWTPGEGDDGKVKKRVMVKKGIKRRRSQSGEEDEDQDDVERADGGEKKRVRRSGLGRTGRKPAKKSLKEVMQILNLKPKTEVEDVENEANETKELEEMETEETIEDADKSVAEEDGDILDVSVIESMVDLDATDCAICGMKFKDAKYMRKHLITHSGAKNFQCKVCLKKFMRRYDLHQHLMRIHAWVKTGRGQVVERSKPKKMTASGDGESQDDEGSEDSAENSNKENMDGDTIKGEDLEEGEVESGIIKGEDVQEDEETQNTNIKPDNIIIDDRRRQIGQFECVYCKIICNTMLSLDQHYEGVHAEEDPFKCKDCSAAFSKYTKLQRHISACHTEKRYGCSICGKLFKYFYTMKEHEKIHTDSKAFLCDFCGKGFSLQKYLLKHKERHMMNEIKEEKAYNCRYCEKVFDDLRLYQNHMRCHTDVEDRIHHCDQCPKRFFKATHLKRHMLTHTSVRAHKCDDCGRSYKDKDTLRKHIRFYHPPEGEEPREEFECEQCHKKFYNKGHLKRHMVKHTGEKPFVCPTCNKGFGEKKSLENHIRIHTGERPFKCVDCGKSFIQLSHLRRHKFLHTQIRNEVCKECGKRFFEKADLQKHMRVHTKDRPYKCDLCPMAFSQQNILRCHRRRHTGEKPYVCDICDRGFIQMGALQCHRRLHTGERPYKCSHCGLGFVSKERMKFHTYTHTGENPHICHICGKGFRLKLKLQSHLDSHEGVYRYQCNFCSKGFIEKAKLNRHVKQVHSDPENKKPRIMTYRASTIKSIDEDGVITVITTPAPVENQMVEQPNIQYVREVRATTSGSLQDQIQEEVVETQVQIPYEINHTGEAETTSAVSHIQFEADGEVTQETAANLAALYAGETTHITMPSDSIIYQGDGEDGEEVVYVVIPEDNQTVILS